MMHLAISTPKDSKMSMMFPYGASADPKYRGIFPTLRYEQVPKSYVTSIISDTSFTVARRTMLTNIAVLDCK